jgi:hypothetical protein
MIKPLTAAAVLASVLFVSPGTGETWFFVPDPGQPNPLTPQTVLENEPPLEDSPGWDCRIHGNRICGTVTPDGTEPDTGAYIGGYN